LHPTAVAIIHTRMKIALHSVSYGGVWPGQTVVPLERVIDKAAEFGAEGVMIMAKRPHASVLDMTRPRLSQLKARMDDQGVAAAVIAGYTDLGAGWDFPDNPYYEKELLYVDALVEMASALGAGLVRVFTAFERAGDPFTKVHERMVRFLREAADRAADRGVTLAVQNHHDHAVHHLSLKDLILKVDRPNCRAAFDAWAVWQQGEDLAAAGAELATLTALTTVADYRTRPRFSYSPPLISYERRQPNFQMVAMGEGEIDYRAFLGALSRGGYDGWVAFEMCAPFLRGGAEAVLDDVARRSIAHLRQLIAPA